MEEVLSPVTCHQQKGTSSCNVRAVSQNTVGRGVCQLHPGQVRVERLSVPPERNPVTEVLQRRCSDFRIGCACGTWTAFPEEEPLGQ